ncbi:hypothetical protein D3C77_516660 [compost metagenome]
MASALTTNTRCGAPPRPPSASLLAPSSPPNVLIPVCPPLPAKVSGPPRPSNAPRPMLTAPRATLKALAAVKSAMSAAPTAVMPNTTDCEPSDKLVNPWATVLMPLATRSVAGRMASPMLRIASLTACPVSAHICAEDSRRSARFLSRIPEAFFESCFSCSYSPRLAA